MRVEERIIVAIFGNSCTGKTVVSRELGKSLGVNVRHCGEAVTELAEARSLLPEQLAWADHKRIDEATTSFARAANSLVIIEGRFLDHVLKDVPHVVFIRLLASSDVRERRSAERGSRADVAASDSRDEVHLTTMFGTTDRGPAFNVDTSSLAISEVAEVITWMLENPR